MSSPEERHPKDWLTNTERQMIKRTLTYDGHILSSCSSESLGPLDLSGVSLHPENVERRPVNDKSPSNSTRSISLEVLVAFRLQKRKDEILSIRLQGQENSSLLTHAAEVEGFAIVSDESMYTATAVSSETSAKGDGGPYRVPCPGYLG